MPHYVKDMQINRSTAATSHTNVNMVIVYFTLSNTPPSFIAKEETAEG